MKIQRDSRGLFVLLIFSIIPLVSPIVVDSGVIVPPRNLSITQEMQSSSESDVTLTWTSRWQQEEQQVVNDSSIEGDHVVIRSFWNIPVTSSRILIESSFDVYLNSTPENLSEVIFDTYYLLGNATVNITLVGMNATHDMMVEYSDITLGNYFVPDVIVNHPIRIDGNDLWNFTWSCSDLNANDTNYYSVWVSSDGGTTFQLLQRNLTQTFYVWNSTGFLQGDFAYRVRAFSLDFTVQVNNTPLCSTVNPPGSYWPGDYSDDVSVDWSTNHIITPTSPVSTTTSYSTFVPPPGDSPMFILVIGLSAGMISVIIIIGIIRRRRLGK